MQNNIIVEIADFHYTGLGLMSYALGKVWGMHPTFYATSPLIWVHFLENPTTQGEKFSFDTQKIYVWQTVSKQVILLGLRRLTWFDTLLTSFSESKTQLLL